MNSPGADYGKLRLPLDGTAGRYSWTGRILARYQPYPDYLWRNRGHVDVYTTMTFNVAVTGGPPCPAGDDI